MPTPAEHALLSPSAAERWLHCTPAPRIEAELPEKTSEYAEEGRLAHSVCELLARKKFTVMKPSAYTRELKKLKAHALWQDEMLTTANTYVEHLMERHMSFINEPCIAFEVRVDLTDYVPEAFGTCDCVMIGGDELIITDYKHGKGVPVSPQDNSQMMLYALGALKLYRPIFGDMIKRVSMYIDQPRLNSYGGYTLTVDALSAWGEHTVRPKAALAHRGLGEYEPGSWCRFCRAKAQCRARANANTALEDFKDANSAPALLTDVEISDLLTRGEALVDWYNGLKDYALGALLDGRLIPGWKIVEGRSSRQWADQDKALDTILNAGTPREIVYDTVPKTLSQLEKLMGAGPFAELVGDLIVKPPGKPTLVPASDKRPAYTRAAADFAEVKD